MAKALVLWIVEHLDEVACADRFSHGLQRLQISSPELLATACYPNAGNGELTSASSEVLVGVIAACRARASDASVLLNGERFLIGFSFTHRMIRSAKSLP